MRNAITKYNIPQTHLKPRYIKHFPSRTRARNTRTRTRDPLARFARSRCTTLAAYGRSLSRGRRGRRVYLVHQAVVVLLSRSSRAAIRPHCSSLPAPGRLFRFAFGGRLRVIRRTPTATLHSPPYALIGIRTPIGRLNIVYRLARCIARSLRSLAIKRSSRSSQAPRGHRGVPSLPLLGHRHYGGCLLARYRLHICLLLPRRGRRASGDSASRPRARGCGLAPAALAIARAKVCLLASAVSRRYRFARCSSPALSIASGTLLRALTFVCVRAPPCLRVGATRHPPS